MATMTKKRRNATTTPAEATPAVPAGPKEIRASEILGGMRAQADYHRKQFETYRDTMIEELSSGYDVVSPLAGRSHFLVEYQMSAALWANLIGRIDRLTAEQGFVAALADVTTEAAHERAEVLGQATYGPRCSTNPIGNHLEAVKAATRAKFYVDGLSGGPFRAIGRYLDPARHAIVDDLAPAPVPAGSDTPAEPPAAEG